MGGWKINGRKIMSTIVKVFAVLDYRIQVEMTGQAPRSEP
jgi:hypothetical protein